MTKSQIFGLILTTFAMEGLHKQFPNDFTLAIMMGLMVATGIAIVRDLMRTFKVVN